MQAKKTIANLFGSAICSIMQMQHFTLLIATQVFFCMLIVFYISLPLLRFMPDGPCNPLC